MARAEHVNKTNLVVEICAISLCYASCNHHRRHPSKPVFVDWYLVLGVDEDAKFDVIRRRYRQLVLQLHPDKNRHPKSETAFKLVSQAYEILGDKEKRRAFNIERWTRACRECRGRSPNCSGNAKSNEKHGFNQLKQMRISKAVFESMKATRERLKEELKVIENCLRKMSSSSKLEHPLFNPSNNSTFPAYPHSRARIFSSSDAFFVKSFRCRSYYNQSEGKYETPAFEIKQSFRERWSMDGLKV